MSSRTPRPSARSSAGLEPQGGAADGRQDLLLVVDRPALVGRHARRVVRRDEEAVDVAVRDGEAKVVADEAAAGGARIAGPGARILRQATAVLARLLRIPGEL